MPAIIKAGLETSRPFPLRRFSFDIDQQPIYTDLMGINEILGANDREKILTIAVKYGASNVRVFGSVATGTADSESDIDFLVDLQPGRSLFDLGGLLIELQQLLKRSVDVVTPAGLKPRIRNRVLEEAIAL